MVILKSLPKGLLYDLPEEDQQAIAAVAGKFVRFNGYDELGRAELEFEEATEDDHHRTFHTIWVATKFLGVAPR